MIIWYILSLTGILFLFLLYKFIIQPWIQYKWYVKNLRKLGYKVYAFPFTPIKPSQLTIVKNDEKKYGDPYFSLKKIYPHHDVAVSNIMDKIMIDFLTPELFQDFFAPQNHYKFPKYSKMVQSGERILGRGLFLSEGEEWKRKKKILNSVFTFDFIKSLNSDISTICTDSFTEFEEQYYHQNPELQGSKEVQYKLLDALLMIFSSVIIECFFGMEKLKEKFEGKPISVFMNKLTAQTQIQDLMLFIFGKKFLELGLRERDRRMNDRIKVFRQWGIDLIEKRIKQIQNGEVHQKDLLTSILQSNKQGKYSKEDILAQFATFYLAGMETTANFTYLMLIYIARHPQVEQKLREQVETQMGRKQINYENMKNLKYLECIQRETTRLYGPGNGIFFREATCDTSIKDIPIKRGTLVNIKTKGSQFSEKYFKDPFSFRPERWEKECSNLPPFVEGGFGAGARTCIGKHLAMFENKICIIQFLRRYKKIILPQEQIKMKIDFMYVAENVPVKLIKF